MRQGPVVLLAALAAVPLAGCWSAPNPPETFVGLRLTAGGPELWAGGPCSGVGAVEATVTTGAGESRTWRMSAEDEVGTFETVLVGEPAPGFVSEGAAPDWSTAQTVSIVVLGPDDLPYSRASWDLDDLAQDTPSDQDRWLTPSGRWVTRGDVDDLAEEGIYPLTCGGPDDRP